jgi:hypothetical protein
MAAPRKEARAFLDESEHKRLLWNAKRANCTVAEYLEKLIQADNASKIDRVVSDYHALVRDGLVGNFTETAGKGRKTAE